jgi:hypothetical protein
MASNKSEADPAEILSPFWFWSLGDLGYTWDPWRVVGCALIEIMHLAFVLRLGSPAALSSRSTALFRQIQVAIALGIIICNVCQFCLSIKRNNWVRFLRSELFSKLVGGRNNLRLTC